MQIEWRRSKVAELNSQGHSQPEISRILQTEDKREKIQALSLAKECYSMKLELLTNATVVDDAIRFVAEKSKDKENLKPPSNSSNEDDKEPKEPDNDEGQLEEEERKEAILTMNQVFE
jgi:hypothetical protein